MAAMAILASWEKHALVDISIVMMGQAVQVTAPQPSRALVSQLAQTGRQPPRILCRSPAKNLVQGSGQVPVPPIDATMQRCNAESIPIRYYRSFSRPCQLSQMPSPLCKDFQLASCRYSWPHREQSHRHSPEVEEKSGNRRPANLELRLENGTRSTSGKLKDSSPGISQRIT